jgi:hypothetical protein
LEEAAEHAGHKALMNVDNSILLIVGNPQSIFEKKAQALPIPLSQ